MMKLPIIRGPKSGIKAQSNKKNNGKSLIIDLGSGISNYRAFTLIELLVVAAIISILISIGLASYSRVQKIARDSQRKADLRNVAGALEQFYADYNQYPISSSLLALFKGKILVYPTTCTTPAGSVNELEWGTEALSCGGKTYLSQLPKDPLPSNLQYCYESSSSFQSYILAARLENSGDPDAESSPFSCAGTSGYNYKLTPTK